MNDNLVWSIALAAFGILGLWLAGSNNMWGWAVSFSSQFAWIAFAVVTGQYGFIFTAVAYGWVYGRNFMKWRKKKREALS